MKRTLLLYLYFTIIVATLQAQIVFIPDTYFKQTLLLKGFDLNMDGEIAFSEAMKVDSLLLHFPYADLTGLEAFASLKYLNCSGSGLKKLEVSKLTALQTLICSNNELIVLDISKNPALKELYCQNNSLISLNVCECIDLGVLDCSNNPGLKKVCISHVQFDMIKEEIGYWDKPTDSIWTTDCK
jgi:hypothetical protein